MGILNFKLPKHIHKEIKLEVVKHDVDNQTILHNLLRKALSSENIMDKVKIQECREGKNMVCRLTKDDHKTLKLQAIHKNALIIDIVPIIIIHLVEEGL